VTPFTDLWSWVLVGGLITPGRCSRPGSTIPRRRRVVAPRTCRDIAHSRVLSVARVGPFLEPCPSPGRCRPWLALSPLDQTSGTVCACFPPDMPAFMLEARNGHSV
jgi:hypothetical protein